MAGLARTVATLPLRRRLIGSLIVVAGVLMVLLGFFTDLSGASVHPADLDPAKVGPLGPQGLQALADQLRGGLTTGGDVAATALRHLGDHPLTTATRVATVADGATRLGIALMAAGAGLSMLLLLTPLRGLVGIAAGFGLVGVGLVAGVIAGTNAQLSSAFGGAIDVSVGRGVVISGIGFGVLIVGGALAARRPLAGILAGAGLALTGAAVGLGLALLVGADHLFSGADHLGSL
jgi:hypothetical protein